ncbi:MAG: ATP-binding protein [Bacteroidota bacterium]
MLRLPPLVAAAWATLALLVPDLRAQPMPPAHIRTLTTADGLPTTFVSDMAQDPLGFMWFGTMDGLARYDGHTMQVYRHDSEDPTSIASNIIHQVRIAPDGTLWVVGQRMVSEWRPDGSGFIHHWETLRDLAGSPIIPFSLRIAADGHVWVSSLTHLAVRGPDGQWHVKQDTADRQLSDDRTAGAEMLAYGDNGLLTGRLTAQGIQLDTLSTALPIRRCTRIAPDETWCIVYQAESRSLQRYQAGQWHPSMAPGRPYNALTWDALTQTFWLGGTNGQLWSYCPGDSAFAEHVPAATQTSIRGPSSVERLFIDRSHTLWAGLRLNGLFSLDLGGSQILQIGAKTPTGLRSSFVRALAPGADSTLWIGSYWGGLHRLDRATRDITPVDVGPLSATSDIYGLHEEGARRVWVVSDGVLGWLNPDGTWNRVVTRDLTHGEFVSFLRTRNQTLYMAADSLYRINAEGSSLAGIPMHFEEPTAYFLATAEGPDGRLWMGGNRRPLRWYDPATGASSVFRSPGLDIDFLTAVLVLHATRDALWMGTEQGLYRIDWATEAVTRYTTQTTELPNDYIYGVLSDKNGHIWVSTNAGLTRFDPVGDTWSSYTVQNGLQDNEFNRGAYARTADGQLFFGGPRGLNGFYPDDLRGNMVPPQLALTDLQLSGASTPPLTYRLPADVEADFTEDNLLRFDYAGLHYSNPARHTYRTRLEPLEADWTDMGTARSVIYRNLPPGDYTFSVQAANANQVWSAPVALAHVVLHPPFWMRRGVQALGVLLLILLSLGVFRWRTGRLRERQLALARTVRERTAALEAEKARTEQQADALDRLVHEQAQFFSEISHETRTPLTLMIGPLEDILEERHGPLSTRLRSRLTSVLQNARRLLTRTNQLLDLAQLDAERLEISTRPVEVIGLLRSFCDACMPLAERQHVDFRFEADAESLYCLLDADVVEKMVLNLLSNALKYTPERGDVTLSLTVADASAEASLLICVADSGPGIPAEEHDQIFERYYRVDGSHPARTISSGLGLALVRQLAHMHDGAVMVSSQPGAGATFCIRLPLVPAPLVASAASTGNTRPRFSPAVASSAGSDESDARPTVLVVEDVAEVRRYIREVLSADYRMLEAENGVEGLQLARTELPDLVLTDVQMPLMDGQTLCRRLKTDADLHFIPVVLLTARAGTEQRMEGLAAQADDYIVKPFNTQLLHARVSNLIAKRQAIREALHTAAHSVPASSRRPAKTATLSASDAAFLASFESALETALPDPSTSVTDLAQRVGMSPTHFRRTVKRLTQQTPNEALRQRRVERGAHLLEQQAGTVAEVAYAVGFSSVSYFGKCFKAHYGVVPTQYAPAVA